MEDLFEAIHISNSTKTPVFEMSSDTVDAAYMSDNLVDYSWYYDQLIEAGHPLIVLSGEYDMRDGAISQFLWMKETLTSLPDSFWEQDRRIYYFMNSTDSTDE